MLRGCQRGRGERLMKLSECVVGWASQLMGKREKVQGHLVDQWTVALRDDRNVAGTSYCFTFVLIVFSFPTFLFQEDNLTHSKRKIPHETHQYLDFCSAVKIFAYQ